jgi:hypothetical protein
MYFNALDRKTAMKNIKFVTREIWAADRNQAGEAIFFTEI